MNRTPPKEVRTALRAEVGFGCPVPGCGAPYLEWHHFDPPWSVRNHHEPAGMIALCSIHHRQADAGAFTDNQLRRFKTAKRPSSPTGRFNWMRNELLVVAGGTFFHATPVIFNYNGRDVIFLSRDPEGYLRLSLSFPIRGESRLRLEDNDWTAHGELEDLECPPSGKLIEARYPDGDRVRIEFIEFTKPDKLEKSFPFVSRDYWEPLLKFPLTAVLVNFEQESAGVKFGPTKTLLGPGTITGGMVSHCRVAIGFHPRKTG